MATADDDLAWEVVMSKTEGSSDETPAERRYRRLFAGRKEGESFVALSARVGVAPGTLSWWRHELRRRDRARAAVRPTPTLLPVRVLEAASQPVRATSYEIALAGGRRLIRVSGAFEPEAVRALVAAVEGASC